MCAKPVDIIVCGQKLMLPFDDGSIWELDLADADNQSILGLNYMHDFTGIDMPARQVSALDFISLAKVEHVIFGDVQGSLVILKDKRPVFFDRQFSTKLISLKWTSTSLHFASLTTDGLLRLC